MQVHYDFADCENIRNAVITTGSFDGVHVGHRVIINSINKLARGYDGESVLITFFPHPRKVLFPDSAGKELQMINTQREKIDLLSETGLDHLIIVTFTREFSMLSPVDFVRNYLVKKLNLKRAVIGFNHHFGHNREGNFDYLHELGKYYNFEVSEIEEQEIQNETVSSTRIRKAIQEGYIQKANAYLDSFMHSKGSIAKNRSTRIASMNFYRQIIEEPEKLLPPDGFYAGSLVQHCHISKVLILIRPNQDVDSSGHPKALYFCVAEAVDIDFDADCNIRFHMALNVIFQNEVTIETEVIIALEKTIELIY